MSPKKQIKSVNQEMSSAPEPNKKESKYSTEKSYGFILKPVFFILSLMFATWLTLYIERLAPSDFGKYEYLFTGAPKPGSVPPVQSTPEQQKQLMEVQTGRASQREYLKKICADYKAGIIDSTDLDWELEKLLVPAEISKK